MNCHLIIVLLKQSPAAHRVHLPEGWCTSTHSVQRMDFITKDQWIPNLPNINPLDYRVLRAMLKAYSKLKTKPKTIAEIKEVLQVIWDNLPQGLIDMAVKDLSK